MSKSDSAHPESYGMQVYLLALLLLLFGVVVATEIIRGFAVALLAFCP